MTKCKDCAFFQTESENLRNVLYQARQDHGYELARMKRIASEQLASRDAEILELKNNVTICVVRMGELRQQLSAKDDIIRKFRRAIGDHYAPNDCYATGPLTGNAFLDLVQCPACSAIEAYEEALAATEPKP